MDLLKLISLLLIPLSLDGCFCASKNAVVPIEAEESQSDRVPSVNSLTDGVKKELYNFAQTLTYKQIKKFHDGKLPIDAEKKLTAEQKIEHNFFMQCIEDRYQKDKLFIHMLYP